MYKSYSMELAGRTLTVDINRVAKQANGAALMHYGDTTVLSTATASKEPREGIDFFPLSVEYEEKMYAVGKIPGGFNKREGKASEHAILTSRVIDRPMRPLFPKDYRNDVTLVNMVMSVDPQCNPEIPAMLGSSIATCISDIPFDGPCATTQVGLINGEYIINPTMAQKDVSDLQLTVASTREKVIMIEAGAKEVPEDKMIEAIYKAHEVNQEIIKFIDKIVEECGKPKHSYESCAVPEELFAAIKEIVPPAEMEVAVFSDDKQTREENIREMSFDLYAYKELRKGVAADCEDRYDQLERRMKFPDEVAQNRFDWKQSKDFIGEIEGFLAILEDRLIEFKEIEFRGMTLTEEDLIQLFYYKFTETPLLKRMDAVKDYFIDSWETLKGRNISEDDQEMLQMKFDKMYTTKDIYTIYNWMLDDCGCDLLPEVPYEKRKLPYEDVFPMLYLKYRLSGGNSTHKNIKHLVIDEMQDYSYLQYTILESLFHCRMTILGDRAQTLDTKQQDVLRFLPKLLGREIRTIEIKKSYRNTLEIARYAEKVSGVSDLELLDRHGKEVVEKTFNTDTELLDELVCHLKCPGDFETAALITTTEEEAFDLSRLLKLRGINVSYVDRNSSAFKKGLKVTTFYLAKGMEFDQVFALRGAKENPLKNQAEYICATRALHELYVYEIADSLSK